MADPYWAIREVQAAKVLALMERLVEEAAIVGYAEPEYNVKILHGPYWHRCVLKISRASNRKQRAKVDFNGDLWWTLHTETPEQVAFKTLLETANSLISRYIGHIMDGPCVTSVKFETVDDFLYWCNTFDQTFIKSANKQN